MRTVVGYTPEGAKIWSENSPASTSYFEGKAVWRDVTSVGGSPIEPAVLHRGEPTSVKHQQQKLRRLRGSLLEPGQKA